MAYLGSLWTSGGTKPGISQQPTEARAVVFGSAALFESAVDYLEIFDEDHSEAEDRFIAIGAIERGLVVVVYTEPEEDLVRIIGARMASKREQSLYRSYMDENHK